jgi:branched-chain amino acid transport system ATP-binding protein
MQMGVSGGALMSMRGVHAGYDGVGVLHDVSLEVRAASVVAVLGANGAGKTTLLRTLSGLVQPSAGAIWFDGQDLAAVPVERRVRLGLAYVPQARGVVDELTVDENLRLGALWRRDRADAAGAVGEMYELFPPLAIRRSLAAHHLSGGERQMLAIGRALAARPRLLLLDEPSLGLAPRVAAQLMALLRSLRDTTGLAVLLVEHNVRSALSISDASVTMASGRLVGPSSEDH